LIDSISLLGFVTAALVVLVTPGPGVLYTIARSLSQGQQAGLVSVLGLSVGALVHVIAATVGLSAVLLASAAAFDLIKLLGAAYLIYLGLQALLSGKKYLDDKKISVQSKYRLFIDGVIVSILNPKIAIFFLAFLPQFVDTVSGSVPQQILFLGLIYVGLALVTDSIYALLAGRLRHWLDNRIIQGPLPQYASGIVYLGLGVSTALLERR